MPTAPSRSSQPPHFQFHSAVYVMVLLLAKNSKANNNTMTYKSLFRPNFLKQVVIEIQKMEHPRQKIFKVPPRALC